MHEDRIARLEERIKELQKAHQTQGQQTEIIGAHQLLGDVSVQELKERIEKIEALAQPVTISDPYISQEQYKGHPENPGFTQLLPAQPSESQPEIVVFQDSEVCSIVDSEFSDLLNSSHGSLPSSLPIPKTPVTSPGPKKRGQPAAKVLHQEKPVIKETLDSPPDDVHPGDRGQKKKQLPREIQVIKDSPDSPPDDVYLEDREQKKAGGAARSKRRSSPRWSPRKEGSRADESSKRKAQEQHKAFTSSNKSTRDKDMKKMTKRESPRKTPKEAPVRRESTNSRRSTEARRKASNIRDTSNRGSTGYNRSKPRGKEVLWLKSS